MPRVTDRTTSQTYLCKQWSKGHQGKASQEPAIVDGGQLTRPKLSSSNFVDFVSGNTRRGDPNHELAGGAAVSRSSSATNEVDNQLMPKAREAAREWSLVSRPNLPTVLRLLSPTSTATEGSGVSVGGSFTAPITPHCDMEHPRRLDQFEYSPEGSTFSVDSSGFKPVSLSGQDQIANHEARKSHKTQQETETQSGSRDHWWSADSSTTAGHGRKRLKRTSRIASDEEKKSLRSEHLQESSKSHNRDVSTQTQLLDPPQTSTKVSQQDVDDDEEEEDEEREAFLQAAISLLTLSSHIDDYWKPSSSSLPGILSPTLSSSETKTDLAPATNKPATEPATRLATKPEGETGEAIPGCSSVLSRPSNKRRYRLMSDLLSEVPRVMSTSGCGR